MNRLAVIISTIAVFISIVVLTNIWKLSGEMKVIGNQVNGMSQAIKKSLPSKLSSETENQLAAIEIRLADETKWPTSKADVQVLNEQLASFVNSIPPSAQEELLPRIAPKRWEIDALWILSNNASDIKSIDEQSQALDSLLIQKPHNASSLLEGRLIARKSEVEGMQVIAERANAIEMAKVAIDGKGDAETAIRVLDKYDEDDAKTLVGKLQKIITSRAISKDIEAIGNELKKYSSLDDMSLREYAYAKAHQSIQDIRLRMVILGLLDNKLNADLSALEKKASGGLIEANKVKQQEYDLKVRSYQKWALGEIKKVRQYKDVETTEFNKIASGIDRKNPLSDAYKKAIKRTDETVRSDLIKYMSRINQGLLDEAVGQWFRKVYQDRFEKLTNENEQLEVLKGFAFASKYSVE